MIEVSVIIPTKDRAHYIERALESVYNQTFTNVEIIVVDDGSNDDTEMIISNYQSDRNIPIQYLKNNKSVGGAVARNQGTTLAKGNYIAFLDSDDEWLPDHLEKGLSLIKQTGSHGVYGAFIQVDSTGRKTNNNINAKPRDISMAEYIFSKQGDTRTSTFIFKSDCFKNVLFDPKQDKHQDWDLAIRFEEKYKFATNTEQTVIIHHDAGNRMSTKMNHAATNYLLEKHGKSVSPKVLCDFYVNLLVNTAYIEGKTKYLKMYEENIKVLLTKHSIKLSNMNFIKILLTKLPRPMFVLIYDAYVNYLVPKKERFSRNQNDRKG